MFYITVPKDTNLCRDETIRKIEGMLDRNHVSHGHVDTVCGAWNPHADALQRLPDAAVRAELRFIVLP